MRGLDNEGDERAAEFLPREAGEGDRVAVEGARLALRAVRRSASIARARAPSTAFGGPPPPLRGGGIPASRLQPMASTSFDLGAAYAPRHSRLLRRAEPYLYVLPAALFVGFFLLYPMVRDAVDELHPL